MHRCVRLAVQAGSGERKGRNVETAVPGGTFVTRVPLIALPLDFTPHLA